MHRIILTKSPKQFHPDSDYSFAGQTIAGIEFNGHAKACGSPRGQEMTLEDAIEVYSIL